MITFYYRTLTGSQALIPLPLLDSDRYWPADLDFDGQGVAQAVHPIDAPNAVQIARGGVEVDIIFPTVRVFNNLLAAIQYAGIAIHAAEGCNGNLVFAIPGGGQLQSRDCVLLRAKGRNRGVAAFCQFHFRGPKPVP